MKGERGESWVATNGFDGGVRNPVVADMMGVANRRLGVASDSVSGRRVKTSFYTFFLRQSYLCRVVHLMQTMFSQIILVNFHGLGAVTSIV